MTSRMSGFAACAAIMAFAALPLSAAELTHRWSLNGDFADSVGGVDAVKCGTTEWKAGRAFSTTALTRPIIVFLSWTFGTTLSKNQLGSKVQGGMKGFDPIV